MRSNNVSELQRSLIRHLNAGFGTTLPAYLVKAVMAVRINSLSLGYSGIRPSTVDLLVSMFNHDIIPVVPKRGSVSASGDLMPTSYIAACMIGRSDARVLFDGVPMTAPEAFADARLKSVTFQGKEALAVVNSASFSSSLGAIVLYDANIAIVLTQVATALTSEALCGSIESFHPTIHRCLPHPGQQEVASNIRHMLVESKFTRHAPVTSNDQAGVLKQDRYALRSSPQWLGPVVETALESIRRVTTELNSANDNPLIDHEQDEILHGANFQGTSVAVAMDQLRQSLQLCGKLLFGQMQELVNHTMNDGLPPNLAGTDVNVDFGFKGMDTAMASYMSELDYLSNNVTNHVLSTELHNQAVNSMALVSARYTQKVLDILQMMITNIFLAQLQAIDLRLMKTKTELALSKLLADCDPQTLEPVLKLIPWYQFVFCPRDSSQKVLQYFPVMKQSDKQQLSSQIEDTMQEIRLEFQSGRQVADVERLLGQGNSRDFVESGELTCVVLYEVFSHSKLQCVLLLSADCKSHHYANTTSG